MKKALDENKSADDLKKLSEELQQTMFSISQKAYEAVQKDESANAGSSDSASSSSNDNKGDDDVIDAEYTKE